MNTNYKKIAEAVRLEFEQKTGKLFIVFEVVDEQQKQKIKKNWVDDDIEYRLIDKSLILEEENK